MSTESIVDSRTLRQFLAREAHEKETSDRQSPVTKAGKKSKTPSGDQKNMQNGRGGNSQRNDQKKHKTNKRKNIIKVKIKVKMKTTWKSKRKNAEERRRKRERKRRKKKRRELFCVKDKNERTSLIPSNTTDIFSDMETPEGLKKPEYRCGFGGCGATYNSFTWYQKHVKKIHDEDIDKSSWEASVGSSFFVNLDDTTDPNEVTVTQASFLHGIGETSSQKVINRPEAAATSSKGRMGVTSATKRKTTEISSGPMVQVEEKRVKESKEVTKDSLELSSKDSLELSTCQHTNIMPTPEDSEEHSDSTQDTQPTSTPGQSQQRRDELIALANSSGQSENLLTPGLVATPVEEEEVLRTGDQSDLFNTTDLANVMNPSNAIIKELEDQVTTRTKSLNDALSANEVLKTDKARLEREVEYLRSKLEEAEKEVKHKKNEMA